MRIESIQISNKFYEWETDKIDFHSNLTLLVGTSGVGKTQILEGIRQLQEIALGKSTNGFQWDIHFISNSGKSFHWEGEFETLQETIYPNGTLVQFQSRHNESMLQPQIQSESLRCDGEIIITRNRDELLLGGLRMPKLDPRQSAIFILKEEDIIKDAAESFRRIHFKDYSGRELDYELTQKPFGEILAQYVTLDDIRESSEPIKLKALLCAEMGLPAFDAIKERFFSIFPQVEALGIYRLDFEGHLPTGIDWTAPIFAIKEHGVQKWIAEARMSSGMLRTINHICELYLSNEGSVILLDEFENSLGTNCIDILTDDLIHENSGIQYIATSHHPYIINNIPYEYWKIVTRVGGHIVVKDATDYNLGDSKQDAFIRLTRVLEGQYQS